MPSMTCSAFHQEYGGICFSTTFPLSLLQTDPPFSMSLIQKDPLFHRLSTYGALRHPVTTHLTCAVAAEEDHVLQAVHTHWTAGLILNVL